MGVCEPWADLSEAAPPGPPAVGPVGPVGGTLPVSLGTAARVSLGTVTQSHFGSGTPARAMLGGGVDRAPRGPGNPVRNPELTRSGRDVRDDDDATGPAGLGRRPSRSHPSPKTCRLRATASRRAHRTTRSRDTGRRRNGAGQMARTAVLGLPRMGPDRELKFALEAHWAGRTGAAELRETAASLRAAALEPRPRRRDRRDPRGDVSLYDHVLDTAWALGAIPDALRRAGRRGAGRLLRAWRAAAAGARPLEMTKWFDTNYHYLVPELGRRAGASGPAPGHWAEQLEQAAALGIATRPVVLGPFSFLLLSKGLERPLDALGGARAGLRRAAARARRRGRDARCSSTSRASRSTARRASSTRPSRRSAPSPARGLEVCLATYFAPLDAAVRRAARRAAAGRAAPRPRPRPRRSSRRRSRRWRGGATRLSLGVVDGRNVWAADLDRALEADRRGGRGARRATGSRSPRRARCCTSPTRRRARRGSRRRCAAWLAFAAERLDELATLARAAGGPRRARRAAGRLARGAPPRAATRRAPTTPRCAPARTPCATRTTTAARRSSVAARRSASASPLPELPTTTIGSFPQTERDPRRPPRPARRLRSARPTTSASSRSRSPRSSPSRRSSASTCSCTASRSATTWSSTSASSCAASRSPTTAGCSRTAAAASSRRSSTATSRGPPPMTVALVAATPSRSPSGR